MARSRADSRVISVIAAARAPSRPIRVETCGQLRLAFQDRAVFQRLEPVGGERGARRRDVDDGFGRAGGRRAFRGAGAFDDAVIPDAGLREEAARQATNFVAMRSRRRWRW